MEKRLKSHFFQTSATDWRTLDVLLQKKSMIMAKNAENRTIFSVHSEVSFFGSASCLAHQLS